MTECINWQGANNGKGYGITWFNKKKEYAHRVAYIKVNGEITNGKVVMHLCDNRACVNPEHLKLGTQSENLKDMVAKGRNVPIKYKKVTKEQTEQIKKLYATGEYSTRKLAPMFKIGKSQVHKIITRGW